LDTIQQWFDTFDLSIGGQSVPGSQFRQAFGGIKWGNPIFIGFRGFLVLVVEPVLSPTLNRFNNLEGKVLRFRSHRNNGAAMFQNFTFGTTRAQAKEILPQNPMGINA
jgi:hypothetical protein